MKISYGNKYIVNKINIYREFNPSIAVFLKAK